MAKYKVNRGQELVIGGYKPGGKNFFENLAVGYYDQDQLIFIAKIKNGFTPAIKQELFERFKELETKVCPFSNLPEPKNARRGEALTAEAMKKYRWLRPELVAQIEFTEFVFAASPETIRSEASGDCSPLLNRPPAGPGSRRAV